jgi:hypothetical protein
MLGVPFPRQCLKGVGLFGKNGTFDRLPVQAGINSGGKTFFRLVAPLAGILDADQGICAEGEKFFLASEAIFQPPPFPSGRGDKKEQSAAVIEFIRRFFGFGVFDGKVGQRHGVRPPSFLGGTTLPLWDHSVEIKAYQGIFVLG